MSPVGTTLRKARLARGLTLEEAAAALHIKLHYLRALEEDRWDALPSRAQGRGFLRLYADYLGLDAATLLEATEVGKGDSTGASVSGENVSAPTDVAPLADADPAQPIFAEIGAAFRKQREQLGLRLEEAERYTHVKQHYLAAIEAGRLDDLPSPVQGRGMLLHYARFLQLDPDPLLLRFAEALQARHRQRQQPQRRTVRTDWPWLRAVRGFLADRFLVWAAALFSLALIGFGAWQVVTLQRAQQPRPTPPRVADILFPTPTLTPTPPRPTPTPTAPAGGLGTVAEATPTPATAAPQSNAPIQVYLVAQHRAWVKVVADGETVFQGIVVPGASYNYRAQNRLEVLTGDGAALQAFYNQQNLGLLGRFGQVVDRIFTITGVQTPTPTVSPTPTVTPTPTITPTPTVTPTPTATAPPLP